MDWKAELLKRLDALAAKLGTTAGNLWQIYVAQARVEIIQDILVGCLLWAISGFCLYAVIRWDKTPPADDLSSVDGDPQAIAFFVALFAFVIGVYWLYCAVTPWLNPQYWAFRQILSDLH